LVVLFLSGVIAYLLNVTTFMVISHSSPLAFNVAGNFKVILSIVVSVIVFNTQISPLNSLGCVVAFAGVVYYNHVRQIPSPPSQDDRDPEA